MVPGQVSVEADVVERDNGKASACVEGVPTHKMIDAMERLHTIGRIQPSLETAPATAPLSPKATMTQDVVARFAAGDLRPQILRQDDHHWQQFPEIATRGPAATV